MRVVISGSSGLVGTSLVRDLEAAGHRVTRLVRSAPAARADGSAVWDPTAGELDPGLLTGADAVINLNGRNLGAGRWTGGFKQELRSSRLDSTRTLVEAMERAASPPALLVNASAAHYYGDRGEEQLDESASPGQGFLAELCRDWEHAALQAPPPTRVVLLRLGMVIARGGAVDRLLLPFKLGLGGPIGSGRQWWPWVAIDDVIGVIGALLADPSATGPVNVCSPQQVRCSEFTRALGHVLRRPTLLPLPASAARLLLGEMAEELLLASVRLQPAALGRLGYGFRVSELERALRAAVS